MSLKCKALVTVDLAKRVCDGVNIILGGIIDPPIYHLRSNDGRFSSLRDERSIVLNNCEHSHDEAKVHEVTFSRAAPKKKNAKQATSTRYLTVATFTATAQDAMLLWSVVRWRISCSA